MMEISINQNGWAIARLEDIATRITKGGTPTTYGYSFQKSGINFIKVENISDGRVIIKSITDFIGQDAHDFQSKSQLSVNDILFSIAGTIGETCVIRQEYLPANTNQALAIIKGTDVAIIPQLLQLQLETFVAKVKLKARGGAMNNVSLEDLKNLLVYIPPLAEQHRIVARIEELFSSLDKGIEALKTAQQQLKVYRQAVLKYAFEGRLTNPNLQEGELPEGWVVKTFGECTINYDGKRVPLSKEVRSKRKGDYRYYGATEIVDYIDDFLFEGVYLLIGEDGANLLSKSKPLAQIVEGQFWVNNHAHIVQANTNISIKYLCNFFNSLYLDQYVTGTAQPKLTQTNMNKIPVLLPESFEEQNQIVQEIQSRLSVCDKIEESITQSLQQAEALRQSILKKAFEGKLVPQDPSDEPASVLLEKIKANKEKIKPENAVRKKKV
ncbi:MAG: restriction endonuclease subunit S [Saprospiraceae bacterium]|nr:restriction endonuclease subunit S [Candidatus Vicinibacter proximus]